MRIRTLFPHALVLHEEGRGLRMTLRGPLNALPPAAPSSPAFPTQWPPTLGRPTSADHSLDGEASGALDEHHDRGGHLSDTA